MGLQSDIRNTSAEGKWLTRFLEIVCVSWILLHIYAIWRLPFSIDELKVLHLGLAATILFFASFIRKDTPKPWASWFWLGLALISLVITFYFFMDYLNMVERIGVPSTGDVVVGTIMVAVVLGATWREWGFVVPLLTLITLLYALFGQHLGGFLFHSGIDYPRLTGYSSTYFMGTLGSLTGLSATMIVHFILFGALLQAVGGAQLIEKISIMVNVRFRSGAAQTAVISSSMMGMISGSTAANVAITGAFTIPMMKRRGYHPNFAGAVETVASTGGQIMPPVMGVSAFLIAGLTNIPYAQIVIAAFLPAIVYYVNLSFAVMVRSRKRKFSLIKQDDGESLVRGKDVLKEHGHLLIPVIILTWRILIGETPAKAVLYANMSLLVVGLVHTILSRLLGRGTGIMQFGRSIFRGLVSGAREGAKLGIVLGTMGIIVEMFTVTGFGQRLSYAIVDLAGGNALILLSLVALLTLFFGMGMPTPGAYLLAVLLSAPALIKFGFPILSVHMFVFYFAIISALTPPVAIGVLVAVGISGGAYLGTALNAIRLALPGFLLPFYFLYQPVILNLAKNSLGALHFNMLLLIGMFGMTMFFDGFFMNRVNWLGRAICLSGAILIFHPSEAYSWLGFGMLLVFGTAHFLLHTRKVHPDDELKKEAREATVEKPSV
ncbi:MAG: TRAP transporter fused permease subunit [Deltaproteobacteria bacterium]|nr:TRAP transporter fused permease subunit [Deltaproteobacteria bacterium]